MGIAEVIPGVSGGTIAFITGIYEELIETIKGFSFKKVNVWKEQSFSAFWKALNGPFLVKLMGGMVLGVGLGAFTITRLLETYPEPLWAFFFGLILASSVYISREVSKWNISRVLLLVAGVLLAYCVTQISPSEGSDNYLYIFLCGVIAISALILPGISGSFILLLLGMYMVIIPTLKNFLSGPNIGDFLVLAVFGLGCLTGLAVFSRVISWTFKRYKEQTLAFLTGVVLGSLGKIWPWRNPTEIMLKDSGEVISSDVVSYIQSGPSEEFKIMSELNVWASSYHLDEPKLPLCILAFILGLGVVFLMSRVNLKQGT